MTVPLSVCIIARDEERHLPRCLASVAWAAERIVVVDSKSSDATESIAREMGARVFVHDYEGNLEQKRYALEQATQAWVLGLDADEAVTPALAEEIRVCVGEGVVAGYEVNRVTYHLGRWIRHGDFFPDWQLRLFRREGARYVGVNPHGSAEVSGRVARLSGELEHRSYRDLDDQVQRIQAFSRVQAEALFAQGRRATLADLVFNPPARFLRAYVLKRGFLDGVPGFVIAAATSFHVLLKYAKLWELERLGRTAAARAVASRAD